MLPQVLLFAFTPGQEKGLKTILSGGNELGNKKAEHQVELCIPGGWGVALGGKSWSGHQPGVVLLWISWAGITLGSVYLLFWFKPGFGPSVVPSVREWWWHLGPSLGMGTDPDAGPLLLRFCRATALMGLLVALGWMCSCRTRLLLQSFPGFSILSLSLFLELCCCLSLTFSLLEPLSRCPGVLAQLCLSLHVPSLLLGLERTPKANLLLYPCWKLGCCVLLA